jgi:hypothetical protein
MAILGSGAAMLQAIKNVEWAFAHRQELMEHWKLAVARRGRKPIRKIPPLV